MILRFVRCGFREMSAILSILSEEILRAASDGVTDPAQPKVVAIEDGKQPAD
jgi:hypothetical protein